MLGINHTHPLQLIKKYLNELSFFICAQNTWRRFDLQCLGFHYQRAPSLLGLGSYLMKIGKEYSTHSSHLEVVLWEKTNKLPGIQNPVLTEIKPWIDKSCSKCHTGILSM